MRKVGFTLLELLIALVLLVSIGALVSPPLFRQLEEQKFESAAEMTVAQFLLARSQAQIDDRAVEVVYCERRMRLSVRYYERDTASEARVSPGREVADVSDPPADRASSADRSLAEPWAERVLSHGVRIVTFSRAAQATANGIMAPDHSGEIEEQTETTLALFLSDGSAMCNHSVWLSDDRGHCCRLDVNPWSGLTSCERQASQPTLKPSMTAMPATSQTPPRPASLAVLGRVARVGTVKSTTNQERSEDILIFSRILEHNSAAGQEGNDERIGSET